MRAGWVEEIVATLFSCNKALDIYNVAGQRVRRLAQGRREAGRYSSVWDGRDAAGRPLGNGLYFVRLETEAFSQVRKLMLLE